jgi:hypothetical protein
MSNTASDVWADRTHRSQEIEERLAEGSLKRRVHRRAYPNHELNSEWQKPPTRRAPRYLRDPNTWTKRRVT